MVGTQALRQTEAAALNALVRGTASCTCASACSWRWLPIRAVA
jgi:hypothetical protein